MIYFFRLTAICFCLLLAQPISYAQESVSKSCLNELDTWQMNSKQVGRSFTVYVHLPEHYKTDNQSYPVLYLTDGDWNTSPAITCIKKLEEDYPTTQPIIVGIGYGSTTNMRETDLEPEKGAEAFYQFINTELIPLIEKNYRTNNQNILYGYSYGGYFVNYVLFNHTTTFKQYLIGGIPAWPTFTHSPTKEAKKYFSTNDSLKVSIYYGVGAYEETSLKELSAFEEYMKSINYKGARFKFQIIPDAGHGAANIPVLQNALSFAFCKKHTAINLAAGNKSHYSGKYVNIADTNRVATIYLKKDKLFMQTAFSTNELIPFANRSFFMSQYEYCDIVFNDQRLQIQCPGEADKIYLKTKGK